MLQHFLETPLKLKKFGQMDFMIIFTLRFIRETCPDHTSVCLSVVSSGVRQTLWSGHVMCFLHQRILHLILMSLCTYCCWCGFWCEVQVTNLTAQLQQPLQGFFNLNLITQVLYLINNTIKVFFTISLKNIVEVLCFDQN